MNVRKTGAWEKAARVLHAYATKLHIAISTAVKLEAHDARTAVVKGIAAQAPGGAGFKPLATTTLAVRKATGFGGKKALIRTGELRKAVVIVDETKTNFSAFVGILRTSTGKDGKKLINVAEVHEFGKTITHPATERSRRFLFWALSRAGKTGGERTDAQGGSGGSVMIKIPPRPFFGPVWANVVQPGLRKRMELRINAIMLGLGGRV